MLSFLGACGATPLAQTEDASLSAESRIIGGVQTDALPGVGAFGGCTGTLVGPRTVLTAGHCVAGRAPSDFWFDIGPNAYRPLAQVRVTGIDIAPGFSPRPEDGFGADVALLTLERNAPAPVVRLINRVDPNWASGTKLVFMGYGQSGGGRGIGIKRAVQMPITGMDSSHLAFGGSGQNICFGDSGGPSFYVDGTGTPYLVGVTSYTTSRDCSGRSVQTRVDAYKGFIGVQGVNPAPPAPGNTSAPSCNGETYTGRCNGSTVIWCERGRVLSQNCGAQGGYCGFAANARVNACFVP